jgi:methylmalonyl-CoA/ethylmalonyl-CoA epimerase
VIECAFFGKEASFHHVGLAVKSIREVSPSSDIVVNKTQGVSMAFIRLYGITIELLEPLGDTSPIARSLQTGVKLLHLCFEVPDLDVALDVCRSAGFHRVSRPVTVPEFEGRKVVWVFSRQYGLFELLEQDHGASGRVSDTTG